MTSRDLALASTVKRLRHETGLSLRAFAAKAAVEPSTLSRVERGINSPMWGTLQAIAGALDMSMTELVSAVEQEQRP
jgi:transcriptional regulator with XRE-family HTH domain